MFSQTLVQPSRTDGFSYLDEVHTPLPYLKDIQQPFRTGGFPYIKEVHQPSRQMVSIP